MMHSLNQNQTQPVLEAQKIGVKFTVDGGSVEAVRDVSFQLHAKQTIALVGESGSGKSVTARAIMKLLSKRATLSTNTVIKYNGENMAKLAIPEMNHLRGNRIAMIFQEPMSSLNPIYTIGAQICEVLILHQKLNTKTAMQRAIELLAEVHLPDPEHSVNKYPHQLSGGQRQRVMIAMALANRPDILIADEPTTALDVTVQAQILHLIDELKEKYGMGVILITHDLTVVQQFANYVYVMQYGEVKESGTTTEIFDSPQHPYTKRLLDSEPKGIVNPLPEDAQTILQAEQVRVCFSGPKKGWFGRKAPDFIAVDDLSLTLKKGETLGIVGESGSGKTTFGQSILNLISMNSGTVSFHGEQVNHLNRKQMRPFRSRIQIVFQDPFASLNPRMSVQQIIEEGLIVNNIGKDAEERTEIVKKSLRDAGLPDTITTRFSHEFSGGQRQRIAIARAIALDPELILLDEPTSALDLSVQSQIIELLRSLQRKRGLSYLFISHDLKVVRALCHRVIVMQHGKIVEQGPVNQVLVEPKTEYTKQLVRGAFEIAI